MAPNGADFSDDQEHFALRSADGKLRIFETKSSKLRQEYVPEGHLNHRIHSIHWFSTSSKLPSAHSAIKRNKKRKVDVEDSPKKEGVLVGLDSGSIIFYNINTAEVSGKLSSNVNSPVTAIATKGNDVFAGLSNGIIVRWKLGDKLEMSTWRANARAPSPVSVLVVHPTKPWLISASRTISVWDYEKKEALQTFSGHLNPVRQLLLTPSGEHLASIAEGERNVNVWPVGKVNQKKSAAQDECIATFVLQDFPIQIDLAISGVDGSVKLSAVTEEGSLCIFSETLNGKCKTPSKPSLTIQIATNEVTANSDIELLRILAAKFPKNANEIFIAYGEAHILCFEKTDISTKKEAIFLNRKHPRKSHSDKETISRVVGTASEAQYMTAAGTKRPVSSKPIHLSMEDRLKNLSVEIAGNDESRIPSGPASSSLAELLQQGLLSSDKVLQKEILLKKDQAVIASTVAELPVKLVPMLVQELAVLVHWSGWKGETATKWLTEVLMHHSSLVLGSPQLLTLIQPILGLVEARLAGLQNLLRLKGRLALLMAQMALRGKMKKMSPKQNNVTSYDIEDDSDESSDEDNLIIADSMSGESDEDDEEFGNNVSGEEEDDDESDDAEEVLGASRVRCKRKEDSDDEMDLDC
ncbi:WD repeat-containing protein 43-like [Cloeon dipterum]|uniref:WD repeat-containing protein 43-like n=1 Tax=Cloeon dipterum TaxID=197152 RepID=UPI00321F7FB4